MDEFQNNRRRKSKQAILLPDASIIDINKSTLDFFPAVLINEEYIRLICDLLVDYLSDILKDKCKADVQYNAKFMSIHKKMTAQFDNIGFQVPNAVLDWWCMFYNSRVFDLLKRNLYLAPLFLEPARLSFCTIFFGL